MIYPRYSLMFPSLKEVRDSLERTYFQNQSTVEEKAKSFIRITNKRHYAI